MLVCAAAEAIREARMQRRICRWPPEELEPFREALAAARQRLEKLREMPIYPY
jgi:hypothetical protein